VGNGDDLDVVQAFAEDHRKRIALENYAAGAVQVRWANQRAELQASVGATKFHIEVESGIWTLDPIMLERCVGFCFSVR
jgi:hypothetical protein